MNTNTASNIIPFSFGAQEVRALLISDQPWFVASDVCASLSIGNASLAVNGRADRESDGLDEDEKGLATVNTPYGDQQMLVVSESGLYSLIFKSRKKEAKRFQKWVTGEVLPAIRKHGRYSDDSGKMATLVHDVIGVSGANLIGGVISQKVSILPAGVQRQARHRMHSVLHTRFSVPRTELIPSDKLDAACEYVAAYVLEGEWISANASKPGTFAELLGRPLGPVDRWMVHVDPQGQEQFSLIPADACVMTVRDLIAAMLNPGELLITRDEVIDFTMAALSNLKGRMDWQADQIDLYRKALAA